MNDILEFKNRTAFRQWLNENGTSSEGVWLLFGKKGGPVTLSAAEDLEEALCFGWIDGQMKRLDETKYKKYFARRRSNSKWSAKSLAVPEDQILILSELLKEHEPAYTNFLAMSPSVRKTYTRAYFDAKTDAGRSSRLTWIIQRLNKNLKPM